MLLVSYSICQSTSTLVLLLSLYILENRSWHFAKQKPEMQNVETLNHGKTCLISRCCFQTYKLPTFLSDHLDELTGCTREYPSADKALHPTRFLKDTSCPFNQERNWTPLFHGERKECAWNETGVCVSASVRSPCVRLRVAMTDNGSQRQRHAD